MGEAAGDCMGVDCDGDEAALLEGETGMRAVALGGGPEVEEGLRTLWMG